MLYTNFDVSKLLFPNTFAVLEESFLLLGADSIFSSCDIKFGFPDGCLYRNRYKIMEVYNVHIRQNRNSESVSDKACNNFYFFGRAHRLDGDSLCGKNLLLQFAEAAGLGKHDLWVSGCLFQTDPFSIFKRMPLRNHYRDIRIPDNIRFHPISEDPNRNRYHIFHPKVLLRSPVSSGCK